MAKSRALYSNNAQTTLASSITTSSVSFNVADASAFPTITGNDYFYVTLYDTVNIEIVKVTAVSGVTFTVSRAQEGTTASAFASATTKVGNLLTAADLTNFARLDDHMASLSMASLTAPSTMNGNSYALTGDLGGDNVISIATADTTNDVWSFSGYPALAYTGAAGASATTTVIQLANAQTVLPDQSTRAYIVQFTSGALKGQARFISAIGASSFTMASAVGSAPGNTDAYTVYQRVGSNTVALAQQQSTMFDPLVVTPTTNFVSGAKRITSGVVQQYNGTTWTSYPLNYIPNTAASIGSYTIAGANAGYAGFIFSGSIHNQSFLASTTIHSSGIWSVTDSAWDWRWDNGTLAVGTVPYANVSGTPNLTVYAPIASPTFTGTPAAPTAANGTNTTQLATTAFVHNAVVFTGNATAGTKTYTQTGIIEQWFESFQAGAGGGIVSISYPVAFANSAGKPRITLLDANLGSLGASNFVVAQPVTSSLTGCTVNIGQNGGGTRDVTLLIEVRGT